MKNLIFILSAAFAVSQMALMADIVVPGADGQDCELTITQNTVIDLSLATSATWNASYNSLAAADPNRVVGDFIGKGVYDPEKWAVVFRYTNVSIAAGATVTFKNHPSRAPVVWLVSGNVDIAGTVSLNGQHADNVVNSRPLKHAEPGPGGFRGGVSSHNINIPSFATLIAGSGFGMGGGNAIESQGPVGHGGNFSSISYWDQDRGNRPLIYGNPTLLPLLGGSGGAGNYTQSQDDVGGGGGGGALLVAVSKLTNISGTIQSLGGNGKANFGRDTGGGSGGAIRLVCSDLAGQGTLRALGGGGWSTGGQGRIRIERVSVNSNLDVSPSPSVQLLQANDAATLWLPDSAPSAKLISLEGVAAPADPRAGVDGESVGPDFIVGSVPTSQALIETTNLPQNGTVQVRINPRTGADYQIVDATFASQVSADPLVLRWVADVPITDGYSALQIRIVAP